MTARGIDVSEYNGNIDWQKVKASGKVDFAIIRSGLGWTDADIKLRRDTRFLENVAGCKENNIPFGVYHYSYCLKPENAAREAEYILKLLAGLDPAAGVWLDVEANAQISLGKQKITDIVKTECAIIKRAGYDIGVYSYRAWLENYMDMSQLAEYPVWLAEVDVQTPKYKGAYNVWQYSWKGDIDGIIGDVDLDEYYNWPDNADNAGANDIIAKLDALKAYINKEINAIKEMF